MNGYVFDHAMEGVTDQSLVFWSFSVFEHMLNDIITELIHIQIKQIIHNLVINLI